MNPEVRHVDARDAFGSVAALYRKRKRVAAFVLLPAFAFLGFALLFLSFRYVMLTAVCIIVMMLIADELTPQLICPVCQKKTRGKLERFCPVCGHASIGDSKRGSWAKCSNCGKELIRSRKTCFYPICFCTRCSAHLDDSGV